MPEDIVYEPVQDTATVDPRVSFMRRIVAVQRKLMAPKSKFNSFGKYYFRSCEDILEAVKPLLEENDLLLSINDEMVVVNDRYYVHATATLYDVLSGESISTSAYAREPENKKGSDQSQVTGSSSTYARKYALNGLFLIDDNKDADESIGQQKPKEPPMEGSFTARCTACGTRYTFNDRDYYLSFIAHPGCCATPHWEVE